MTAILSLGFHATSWAAIEIYVSPSGNNQHAGSRGAPLKTLAAARDAVRNRVGKEPVTIHVEDGVYYLPETLLFTPEDSGSAKFPVLYQATREGGAVLSGGVRLELQWKPGPDGIQSATTPRGIGIDQLFLNGKRLRMARYPNFDPAKTTDAYQGFSADAFSKERAARWANPAGGYIHAMHAARWGGYHYRITGKNPDGNIAYEGGWQNNRQMGMHKEFRMVENIQDELDAPGEWFHDANKDVLYLIPEAGTDLSEAVVEVVRLRTLVEFKGSMAAPVKHITLKGFTYRHAARTFMDTKEPLLRSDWAIHRGGSVLLTGTEDVSILDGDFDQVGGNAVFVNFYNRRARIQGCHIHDAGASGVCFVGDPLAVRSPLFEYKQSQDLSKIDREPGPKNDNYPADSVVEDCLIHGIGRVERQPAGVQISMSFKIIVRDTSIYDCARAGINISEGTWGGHLIERCDVFDTVLETHDHGSFNSWGRDRFWSSNHRGLSQPAVQKDPKLPFLDVIEPITIRDSRWRCDHGWDIDLDDGSSNYVIYNNLMLNGGLKFREGYGRKAYNNILINSGFHPHVWFDDSDSRFYQNIVMRAHAPIGQPANWGMHVDGNFFSSDSDRMKHRNSGADAKSIAGDPMFTDAPAGDFRVKDSSPALKIGFQNFPMDRFGVKKASLKKIAKTPVIPTLLKPTTEESDQPANAGCQYWLGALLHGIQGEEFSAFGVAKEDGGVQLVEVPAGSAAHSAGFKPNDLIQEARARKIQNVPQLLAALTNADDASISVRIIRNQKPMEIKVSPLSMIIVELADHENGFTKLNPGSPTSAVIAANQQTNNDPLVSLTDGKLAGNYGPVFGNGVRNGAYRMDLGTVKSIQAIKSWSHNTNGNRGTQHFTIYGSASPADPGWDTSDKNKFVPLATIDTSFLKSKIYTAAAIQAQEGKELGSFRWIVWETRPITPLGENTSYQELQVVTQSDRNGH
jgi:hypothetical protein